MLPSARRRSRRRSATRPRSIRRAEYLTRNASQLDQLNCPVLHRRWRNRLPQPCRLSAVARAGNNRRDGGPGAAAHDCRGEALRALLAATPDEALYQVRSEADRDLAPYRRKMTAPQIEHLQKQYIHKRLFEQYRVPRLSLFYM